MSIEPNITRRRALAAGAGTAGIAVLAACSSSTTQAAGSSKVAGQGASSSSSSPGSPTAASSSAASSGSSGATAIATLADVPVGGAISVELPDGKPAIVARPTSTTAVCFSAICTHQGCTVKPAGKTLDCPCHGSKYNALTGAVVEPPAPSPLPAVAVAVQDGKVVLAT